LKINSYQIGMDSVGTFSSTSTRKLTLNYSKQSFDDSLKNTTGMETGGSGRISSEGTGSSSRDIDHVRQRFVLYLWQMFFGTKKADELARQLGISTDNVAGGSSYQVITLSGVQEVYYEESENLSFSSKGSVTTADGRQIDFNLDVSMSREFEAYYREEGISLETMCDPLVLNFNGDMSGLSDQKFYFDLDCDGSKEEISVLQSGNGFLALDKNNDGIIGDGSELFGTKSGDGFKDLAKYDEDHNGWIDENDSVFDKLKIWIKDEDGNDRLLSLKDKNVGAIYLGNVHTDYGRRSDTNGSLNGYIRKTGIFMYEDGSGAGLINHLDFALSS